MAQYSINNTHHVLKLPLPPNPWHFIVLLYIYIAHPNPPLCFCPPTPPQNFWGEVCVCVCVCGQFWPTQNPQFESKRSPSHPDFLWQHNIHIITNWTQPAHLALLASVNYDKPHPPLLSFAGVFVGYCWCPYPHRGWKATYFPPYFLPISLTPPPLLRHHLKLPQPIAHCLHFPVIYWANLSKILFYRIWKLCGEIFLRVLGLGIQPYLCLNYVFSAKILHCHLL